MAQCLIQDSTLGAIAQAIRTKKGVQTLYKPAQMAQAISSIPTGSGGNAIQIGGGAAFPSFMSLFEALEQGTAVTGTFILTQPLTKETPIFDANIRPVRGILLVDIDRFEPSPLQEGLWLGLITLEPGGGYLGAVALNANGDTFRDLLPNATWQIVGGTLAVTPAYAADVRHSPFFLGHNYRWVVW